LVTNIEGPRFETRIYPESEQVAEQVASLPEVRRALFETGMPAALLGGRYRADPRLTVLPLVGGGSVIRFGTSGLAQAVGVDVRTGNVLGVLDVPERPTILINTAVDLFTATVRGMFERFPYYGKNAEWTEIDSACAELREIVRSIDAAAAVPGCYWPGFVDDVQMGDFSTEDILAWHRRNAV
jgi:hypothetical protein